MEGTDRGQWLQPSEICLRRGERSTGQSRLQSVFAHKSLCRIAILARLYGLIDRQGRPRLKNAIAKAYSPFFGKEINPDTEVTITTGANEGILCAFMGFIEPGDEVIVFEPFFDQWVDSPQMSIHQESK